MEGQAPVCEMSDWQTVVMEIAKQKAGIIRKAHRVWCGTEPLHLQVGHRVCLCSLSFEQMKLEKV